VFRRRRSERFATSTEESEDEIQSDMTVYEIVRRTSVDVQFASSITTASSVLAAVFAVLHKADADVH